MQYSNQSEKLELNEVLKEIRAKREVETKIVCTRIRFEVAREVNDLPYSAPRDTTTVLIPTYNYENYYLIIGNSKESIKTAIELVYKLATNDNTKETITIKTNLANLDEALKYSTQNIKDIFTGVVATLNRNIGSSIPEIDLIGLLLLLEYYNLV